MCVFFESGSRKLAGTNSEITNSRNLQSRSSAFDPQCPPTAAGEEEEEGGGDEEEEERAAAAAMRSN